MSNDILSKEGMRIMGKALVESFKDYETCDKKLYVFGESTIEFDPPIEVGNPFTKPSDYTWQFEGERDESVSPGSAEGQSNE